MSATLLPPGNSPVSKKAYAVPPVESQRRLSGGWAFVHFMCNVVAGGSCGSHIFTKTHFNPKV